MCDIWHSRHDAPSAPPAIRQVRQRVSGNLGGRGRLHLGQGHRLLGAWSTHIIDLNSVMGILDGDRGILDSDRGIFKCRLGIGVLLGMGGIQCRRIGRGQGKDDVCIFLQVDKVLGVCVW